MIALFFKTRTRQRPREILRRRCSNALLRMTRRGMRPLSGVILRNHGGAAPPQRSREASPDASVKRNFHKVRRREGTPPYGGFVRFRHIFFVPAVSFVTAKDSSSALCQRAPQNDTVNNSLSFLPYRIFIPNMVSLSHKEFPPVKG